ncbi:serine/threonine/tyrosine-protein kinase HT1-like [Penaeus monodon]|uniref:serine/threonine/tyrosine-protein kinase HT1-like n=1 Tax=Penaeus monodon TaxID=6687 RepID=UPI0018A7BC03|nr:serine/threonine/tyrosine-protein kinase HT1-like [Penaeus monodon]
MQDKGVVHNDLKGNNVMLDDHQEVHLNDFGVATWKGCVVGCYKASGKWLAPEVLQNEPSTFASDVYSVGMILKDIYEVMCFTSDKFSAFVSGATNQSPEQRPSIQKLASLLQDLKEQS